MNITNFKKKLLIFLFLITCSGCIDRTLDYSFNDDCKDLCKNKNIRLGHITATGSNDTLHYIWDFTKNPTIFFAATTKTAKFHVDWKKYLKRLPGAVYFSEKPIYTFGVVIERILEFDDIHDTARISDNVSSIEVDLTNFQWQHKNLTKHDNFVEFYLKASDYKDSVTNETRKGSIEFSLQGFSTLNHSHITPRMLHSENATQIDIIINNLTTARNFTKSRFAFELLFASENDPNSTLNLDQKWKLDDEFTPGIFEMMELITKDSYDKIGYIQWRPVSYKNVDRVTTQSTSAFSYPVKNTGELSRSDNFLYLYYQNNEVFNKNKYLAQRVNISIGEPEDGFYKDSRYSTWTFIVGYGSPPEERFSLVVGLILAIGIGIPIIVLIAAGIFKITQLRKERNDELIIR